MEEIEEKETCIWTILDCHDFYISDCGIEFELNEGTPKDNNMSYCCGCGKKLISVIEH